MSIDVTWPIKKTEKELAFLDTLKNAGISPSDATTMARGITGNGQQRLLYIVLLQTELECSLNVVNIEK